MRIMMLLALTNPTKSFEEVLGIAVVVDGDQDRRHACLPCCPGMVRLRRDSGRRRWFGGAGLRPLVDGRLRRLGLRCRVAVVYLGLLGWSE